MKEEVTKVEPTRGRDALGFVVAAIILLLAGATTVAFWGQDRLYADALYPNTLIAGHNLGEFSHTRALSELEELATLYLERQEVITTDGTASWSLKPGSLDVKYDLVASIEATDPNRDPSPYWTRIKNLFGESRNTDLIYSFNEKKLDEYIADLDNQISTPYQNAGLDLESEGVRVTKSKIGLVLDKASLKRDVLINIGKLSDDPVIVVKKFVSPKVSVENLQQTHTQIEKISESPITLYNLDFQKSYSIDSEALLSWLSFDESLSWYSGQVLPGLKSWQDMYGKGLTEQALLNLNYILKIPGVNYGIKVTLDTSKLGQYVKSKVATDLNKPADNAQLAFKDDVLTVVKAEENGWSVDEKSLREDIETAIKNGDKLVNVNLKPLLAQVRSDNLDELGITKLISTGSSSFAGSPSNRVHNIRVGTSRFEGIVIAPGKEFSFNEYLGPVEAYTGYLPELVIKGDKTIPEYGGGLCQVSSTTFRAALNAGLKITERRNHSYPVVYYKWPFSYHGTDATIYPGAVDLKFINDTGHWILIQTRMEGTKLYFDFYGQLDQEREIKLGLSEYDYGYAGPGSLRAVLNYKVYVGDELFREQTFRSHYKSPTNFPHPVVEKKKVD